MKWVLLFLLLVQTVFGQGPTESHPHCQGWKGLEASPAFQTSVTADAYDINHYGIALELYDSLLYLQGKVTITATPLNHALDSFWFELTSALTIDSIRINGQNRPFSHNNDVVLLALASAIPISQHFSCEVYYRGVPPQQANRRGMMLSNAGIHPSLFTHSSLFWAKNWLPVKQQLSDKIDSIDIYVTTRLGKEVASHGLLVAVDTLPEQKSRWHWRSAYPIAYYLVALSVSDYVVTNRQVQLPGQPMATPILDFSFPVNGPSAALLDTTPRVLLELSRFWGTYPFAAEKYGHAQTNMSGAMEHQTLSGMGFYNVAVIVHEAAHQWFGDYVTCATPSDIWLNEGFATYAEALFVEVFDSTAAAGIRTGWINSVRNNAATGSVYVPAGADFTRVLNTNLSYRKPALVLHNLRWLLGDSLFFGGLQYYLAQRSFGNATTEEFRQLMEQFTGQNLAPFINAWIYGAGFPTYTIGWVQRGNELLVRMNDISNAPNALFDLPYPLTIVYADGRREYLRFPGGFQQIVHIPVNGTVQTVLADPENWVLESTQTQVFRDATLGLTKHQIDQFVLYPNPAKHHIKIHRLQSPGREKLVIADMHGKTVAQRQLTPDDAEIEMDISQLPTGLYFVRCGHAVRRLVVTD